MAICLALLVINYFRLVKCYYFGYWAWLKNRKHALKFNVTCSIRKQKKCWSTRCARFNNNENKCARLCQSDPKSSGLEEQQLSIILVGPGTSSTNLRKLVSTITSLFFKLLTLLVDEYFTEFSVNDGRNISYVGVRITN